MLLSVARVTSLSAVSTSATYEPVDDDVVRSESDDAVDDQQVVLEDERLKQMIFTERSVILKLKATPSTARLKSNRFDRKKRKVSATFFFEYSQINKLLSGV